MTRLRFIHAADLHLDSPFRGLHSIAPEIAGDLYKATFDAYEKIVGLCIEEQVDALLVAGDIFDGADRSLRAQLKFITGLNRLAEKGIRSFICHGNHDPLNGWEAQLTLPAGCHRFGAKVDGVPIFPGEPERAVVYGISYPQREVWENLTPLFSGVKQGPFTIGLLHANVDNNTDHDSYAACTLNDMEHTGINYWALGHIHARQILREANPTVVYPGNPQGRHSNERGARGVYLVEVTDSNQIHRLEFRAVDVVRWELLEVNLSELDTEQALLDAIDQKVAACQDAADGRSVIFRLVLTGRGTLHYSLIRPKFVDHVLERIHDTWAQQRPFLWCEGIQAATGAPIDHQQRRQGTDFVGDLIRLCEESRENPDILSEMRETLEPLYNRGNASQYLRNYVPSDDELCALLVGAEELCLTELLEDDDQ